MTIRRLVALAVALAVSAAPLPCAAANLPGHEIWLGAGGAASFEKDIFNVSGDLSSTPDAAISMGYYMNLDARRAIGFHIYGGAETTPAVVLQGPSGTMLTAFDLYTYNLGPRYRYTFARGGIAPYLFAGMSWAFGDVESSTTGALNYKGFSVCAGSGAGVALGRHFMLSLEGIGSFGMANWETQPFLNSSGKKFNPSIAAATLNLSFVWGGVR